MPAKSKSKASTRAGLDSAIWSVCDILRRSNCAGALQYVPELTWVLFLRILDETEEVEAANAKAVGAAFRPSLEKPYRWRDWAAPEAPERRRMVECATNAFYDFVNTRPIPHLKTLKDRPNATPRQKVMSEIMSSVDRTREDNAFDLKATNPNAKADEDSRSAKDLIDLIRQRSDEIRDILVRLEQIP